MRKLFSFIFIFVFTIFLPIYASGEEIQDSNSLTTYNQQKIVSLDKKKILIIGNSFMYYGNCVNYGNQGNNDAGYFYRLIASNGEKATVIDHTYSGKTIEYITENYISELTSDELNSFDYVVVSEAAQKDLDTIWACENLMSLFPETTQFYFLNHYYNYEKNIEATLNSFEELRLMGMEIVDWGKLVYDIYNGATEVPGATLQYNKNSFVKNNVGETNGVNYVGTGKDGDDKHPNPLSGYIAAQMLYSTITGRTAQFSDYSFCNNSSIHRSFNFDSYISAHYTSPDDTNFPQIFASAKDMYGLQQLIDIYNEASGRHSLVKVDGVEPTCVSSGLTEGYFCAVCKEDLIPQEIIPSLRGHIIKVNGAIAPKCEATGKTEGISCAECGETLLSQKTVPALGHQSTKTKTTPSTLNKAGSIKEICTGCNKIVSETKIYRIKTVSLSTTEYIYNGKSKKPSVIVKDWQGNLLTKGIDYTVSYQKGRKNVGIYLVSVTFKGNYSGTKNVIFNINPKKISNASVTCIKKAKYTGKAIKPTVALKLSGKKLKKNIDYTVTYKNNKKTGKATIKIAGKGNYVGTISKSFVIYPQKPTLRSVKSTREKTMTVKWKKDSNATGYKITYATNSKFTKNKKTITVSSYKKYKKTIEKLSSNKKYYVKLRSYVTIDGKKYYSSYSKTKRVTIR